MPEYEAIIRVDIDRKGNLRLYRRALKYLARQCAYHPVGEWTALEWMPDGKVRVTVR